MDISFFNTLDIAQDTSIFVNLIKVSNLLITDQLLITEQITDLD